MNERENSKKTDGKRKANAGLGWGENYINPPMGPPISGKEIEQALADEYAKHLFIRQLRSHTEKSERVETRLQRYFNSTPAKNMLAKVLCIANYDNQPYTKTEISEQLNISRQAAHTYIEECLEEGWAVECDSCEKHYKASPSLIEAGRKYAHDNYMSAKKSNLIPAYHALSGYRALRKAS